MGAIIKSVAARLLERAEGAGWEGKKRETKRVVAGRLPKESDSSESGVEVFWCFQAWEAMGSSTGVRRRP